MTGNGSQSESALGTPNDSASIEVAEIPDASLPGLAPHHLRELRASGLTNTMIRAAGIETVTKVDRLANLLNWPKYPPRRASAMVFPYCDAAGELIYHRAKPDSPRNDRKGKPIKYETPKGHANRLYLPPGVAAKFADTTCELLITEGEKKALAASQIGFPCLGLVGIFGWKEARREALLSDFNVIAWSGRPVVIVFDSDAASKPEVRDAAARLAKQLQNLGARVRVVFIPEGPLDTDRQPIKQGLDDYLVARVDQPHKALRELLDSANDPEPVDPGITKAPASDLDPATEATDYLQQHTIDGRTRWIHWRSEFFYWERGGYIAVNDDDLRADLVRFLNRRYFKLGITHTLNVVAQVKAQAAVNSRTEAPAWLDKPPVPWSLRETIITRDKIIHLPSLASGSPATIPTTPQLLVTSALGCDYAPTTPASELWVAKLAEWFGGDQESIETIQEWFGYLLTADTSQQKGLFILGPKRSGKGTMIRMMEFLVGRGNHVGVSPHGLTNDFGLAPLLGKSLAVFNDLRLNDRALESRFIEIVLNIIGEDTLTANRKFLATITGKIPARLVLVSNELPMLRDSSGAFASRFIYVRTVKSFLGAEDPKLAIKLLTELPGILNWALVGWQRLQSRGYFRQPAAGREVADEMQDLTSPVGMFVRERCILGPHCRASLADLFGEFKTWRADHGDDRPLTEQSFGRELRAAVPQLHTTKPRADGERYTAYIGIGLRG